MDRFYQRSGKVDRQRAEQYARRNRVDLKPTNSIEKAIQSLYDRYKAFKGEIPVDDALNMYLNARNLRHDLWLEFLNQNKMKEYYKFCDTRFGTFMNELISELDLTEDMYPPDNIKNKTPDILIYDNNNKCIFLGDISVTNVRRMTEQRKYEKYLPIKTFLESKGFRVCHINFIVDDELTNIDRLTLQFRNIGLIKIDQNYIIRTKQYHNTTNKIMFNSMSNCENKNELIRRILTEDKREQKVDIDVNIPHLMDLIPEEPIRSEDEIIKMIRTKTDETYHDFYDNGYEDAKKEFINLYNRFKDRPHKPPKSTLKVIHNSKDVEQLSGHDLINDYLTDIPFGDDETVTNYLLNIMPTVDQNNLMKNYDDNKNNIQKFKNNKVYGKWQYNQITKYTNNILTVDYREKITRGKKNPNEKNEPFTLNPENYDDYINDIEADMLNLGSDSDKRSFLDDTWDAKTTIENDNTTNERKIYMKIKNSQGAQLGQSLSMLYHRLTHLKAKLSVKDNIFIPPNGSFICIIPKEHQPLTNSKSDVPLIFVTRATLNTAVNIFEYEHTFTTNNYKYYISKLCRLPIDKISHWDQAGHKIVACSSFLISNSNILFKNLEKTVGIISYLSLDLHQKTSELLDLLKYVSFMPFSDISRVSKLIIDKFDIMLKTRLDVWVIKNIEDFMYRLSLPDNVTGSKEKLKIFNGNVLNSTLGMKISIPSFINKVDKHNKIQDFVEEISMINIIRGKQFYGSQFMDKSITQTAEWNNEYMAESELYKGWLEGHETTDYPFDSKFSYSKDAIIYALKHVNKEHPINKNKINNKLSNIEYDTFIHYTCTLRGCTKEKYQRQNITDLHTTSLDACLDYYKTIGYDNVLANTINFSTKYIDPNYVSQYTMSEKEQRGGGRPIATPTLITKIGNLMIEKPEQAIGTFSDNNILVAGKHKLKTQSKTYKELLEDGNLKNLTHVYQCTEDQSKFSENDNTRKYYTYIRNNMLLPNKIRQLQYKCMEKMINREHLIKRMPKQILNNINLTKYINEEENGIKALIGWPQGMLNNISTNIHVIADLWITYAYNKAYNTKIITKGLVHSDDSWYAIACNSKEEFIRFSVFRTYAKKLFCLKINEKKLWGSKMIGELVSNFNINGEVLVPISKTIANSFGSLLYQNWVMDVHSQISTLQQLYRQGANIGTMIILSTILRQQILSAYNLQNKRHEYFYLLPIELGGYPDCSVFELGVTGVNCHYKHIFDFIIKNPTHNVTKIILTTMRLSMIFNKTKENTSVSAEVQYKCKTDFTKLFDKPEELSDIDYQSIIVPKRGEVFSCIKHIMPKSKKISITMNKIRELPFESDDLELLVTRPKDLKISLGHLKNQMNTILFSLASEKYTGSKRRLAINQSIQATGKTVQLAGFRPMTMNELITTIQCMDGIQPATIDQLEISFEDDTNLVDLANNIVYKSDLTPTNFDKRKIINRMPDFEDKYRTICPLKNVLLFIIDKHKNTNYVNMYTQNIDPYELIKKDAELIEQRFKQHLYYYKIEYACNLIMQQYYSRIQPRLWAQPELRTDDMQNFLEDMYGKTLNSNINYNVDIDFKMELVNKQENQLIQSLYTVEVLNQLYKDQFQIQSINKLPPESVLNTTDYGNLSQSNYLKYGILMKKYFNNINYLKDYDNKKEYSQHYIKTQSIVKGTYKGSFDVYIKFGNLVMRIYGKPGDLFITVNNSFIKEITTAMFLYVNKDHPEYAYNYSGSWQLNKFWKTISYDANLQLVSYGSNVTLIKKMSPDDTGVGIVINKNLKYPVTQQFEQIIDYEFDSTLRVVYKITESSRIKIDSVKQNMLCPLSNKINLHDDFIDGFNNNDLLHTKAILNITMRRSFSASTEDIKKLLNRRIPSVNMKCIMISYANICKTIDKMLDIDIEDITNPIECETFDMEGETPAIFIEEHQYTNPEDLTAIQLDCLYDESERIGAIMKHSSLLRLFCQFLIPKLNDIDIKDFIWLLFKNKEFIKYIRTNIEQVKNQELYMNDIIEASESIDMDLGLYSFIISNELDRLETYNNFNIKEIIKEKNRVVQNINTYKWYNKYINIINELLSEESNEDVEVLLKMLEN